MLKKSKKFQRIKAKVHAFGVILFVIVLLVCLVGILYLGVRDCTADLERNGYSFYEALEKCIPGDTFSLWED